MRQTKRTFICMNNLADIIYTVYLYLLHKFFQYQEIKYIYKQSNMLYILCRFNVRGIDFVHFYVFPIGFWHCSDRVVFRFFNSIVVNVAYFLNTTTTTTTINFVEHTMPLKTRFISLLYTYLIFVLKLITHIIIMQ